MNQQKQNYYGDLCTEMYELLHESTPQDELGFYLSYAKPKDKILEVLCGSGRFLVPFMEHGYDIFGVDLSHEMLAKLLQKAPNAKVVQADILDYTSPVKYDYIFITSGSVSLFTDIDLCKQILKKIKGFLKPNGRFVFAVDTIGNQCPDDDDYKITATKKTRDGCELILKTKNHFDAQSQTQFSPGIYELYNQNTLLKQEYMDFQTHLYKFQEMEAYLKEIGFTQVKTYCSFAKNLATSNEDEMFLYECTLI